MSLELQYSIDGYSTNNYRYLHTKYKAQKKQRRILESVSDQELIGNADLDPGARKLTKINK